MIDNSGQLISWRLKPTKDDVFNVLDPLSGQAGSAEDEAFLWSLADLMTLLLIFFVLLYSNSIQLSGNATSKLKHIKTSTTSSIIDTNNLSTTPIQESVTSETIKPPDQKYRNAENQALAKDEAIEPFDQEIMNRFKDSFSNDFYIRWDKKQPVFVLGERIMFNVGDAKLLPDSQSALKRIANVILSLGRCQVVISGHSDNAYISTPIFPSNWELSAARAASVAKYLVSRGVAPQVLVIQGKSEFDPLVPNTSVENRKTNRRVEISLIRVKRNSNTQ
jgi:chemotaxis protein MotB